MFYFRHMVHIIGTTKQRKSTKTVNHTALQNRSLRTTTLVGAKHFNSTPILASSTHYDIRDPIV